MASTFELEIATPERQLVKEQATEAQLPGSEGELGILPGHAPLLSALGIGSLSYVVGGQRHKLAVAGGVIEVKQERCLVLAMIAERPSDIDLARAQAAEKRAMERLASVKENVDSARALNALRRAQARLGIATQK
ncbi:MAG TPA: F0F1 ATP synthase subunit epsilon [Bryobacteraceae bacterium]|nr:F0F1 ATP synthase subunit epsilon [Bryobacteraceae bacterium]